MLLFFSPKRGKKWTVNSGWRGRVKVLGEQKLERGDMLFISWITQKCV